MAAVGWGLKLADTIASWVLSEDGMRSYQKKRLMKERDAAAQEMFKNARTKQDWAALRDYVDESIRLSNEA
jgi:hypothetical protein